jgi:hypothetical protein
MSRIVVMLIYRRHKPIKHHVYTHMDTRDWWEVFMKYTVLLDSGAIMYVPSFLKIGSSIEKLQGKDAGTACLS